MTDVSEREKMLNISEALMRDACDLIRRAGAGTAVEPVYSGMVSVIERLISSRDDVSIFTLRKNILHEDDSLSWTRPLVSVKHTDRRDI